MEEIVAAQRSLRAAARAVQAVMDGEPLTVTDAGVSA